MIFSTISKKYIKNYSYICDCLNQGQALLMQTDTVYGIIAKDPQLIYSIKKRPLKKK